MLWCCKVFSYVPQLVWNIVGCFSGIGCINTHTFSVSTSVFCTYIPLQSSIYNYWFKWKILDYKENYISAMRMRVPSKYYMYVYVITNWINNRMCRNELDDLCTKFIIILPFLFMHEQYFSQVVDLDLHFLNNLIFALLHKYSSSLLLCSWKHWKIYCFKNALPFT